MGDFCMADSGGEICMADLCGGFFVWRILVRKLVWRICMAADFGEETCVCMADFRGRILVGVNSRGELQG